ncbi:MAG: 2Fe-2S iron-sulfur cluster-binding protein [Acidimicrobiia bacterium]|nr:2Fe-2S iron-sulfur cluster-binding protein [Acidimicrobiia bacterium]
MNAVQITIDGIAAAVPEGTSILAACRSLGKDQPTLCYLETLTPVNTCRVCVVQVAGSRVLVPSCSRAVEEGMEISTDSEAVRHTRKMVFEFLASSVDLSLVGSETSAWMEHYQVDPDRYGPPAPAAAAGERDTRRAGHHHHPKLGLAETVAQPVKVHDEMYVRDYTKCILCYKCVEACGPDAQNTFAIQVAGRGFDARISTEFDVDLTSSACVYCGNCIGVCPTGALMFRSEYQLRKAGLWDEEAQTVTRTVCSYCGVGCNLELHVQDNRIVKVTSPMDHEVAGGHLCIKGRFGYEYVQERADLAMTPIDVVLASVRARNRRPV